MSCGAISVGPEVNVTLARNYFFKNEAMRSVGVLGTSFSAGVRIRECVFILNRAAERAGLVGVASFNFGNDVEITDSIFQENIAGFVGGAIWVFPSSVVKIKNCTFERNVAMGAPALNIFANSTVEIIGSTFLKNNSTFFSVGTVYTYSNVLLTVRSCSFISNVASGDGYGGAIMAGPANTLTIKDSIFLNNSVARNGGALCVSIGSTLSMDGSEFRGNFAGNKGGGIMFRGQTALITNSIFFGCESGYGGALFIGGGDVTIRNVSFLNNKAPTAGAVLVCVIFNLIFNFIQMSF
jgi:hypothetical protein